MCALVFERVKGNVRVFNGFRGFDQFMEFEPDVSLGQDGGDFIEKLFRGHIIGVVCVVHAYPPACATIKTSNCYGQALTGGKGENQFLGVIPNADILILIFFGNWLLQVQFFCVNHILGKNRESEVFG